jgi:hypothetical protein
MKKAVKKLLKAAKRKPIRYVLVDGTTNAAAKPKYKIICESPPLPIGYNEIEILSDDQIKKLKNLIELRRRKNHMKRQQNNYKQFFEQLKSKHQLQ